MLGWIYHAPAKPKVGPGITELPPASQIPGLNEFPEGYFPPEETKKLQIHEHDSPYVRVSILLPLLYNLRMPSILMIIFP